MDAATMDRPATDDLDAAQADLDASPSQGEPKIADGQTHAKQVDAAPDEIRVAGTTQLSFFQTGGKKPQSGKVTIQGMSGLPIMDQMGFKKGEFIRFEGVARVEEVGQKDKMDRKANQAVDCVQKHVAYATDVRFWPATSPALGDDAGVEERLAAVTAALEELGDDMIASETRTQLLGVLRGS